MIYEELIKFIKEDRFQKPEYVFKNIFELKRIAYIHITDFAYAEFKQKAKSL